MTITVANISKTGYYDNGQITLKRKPLEQRGLYPIHKPTYTGNIDQLLVLDKNRIIISINPIPELHAYMLAANGSYATYWASWQSQVASGGSDYTSAYNMDDVVQDNMIEAREDMGEVLMEGTDYYAISSPDDSNYSTPQAPTSVNKIIYDYHSTAKIDGTVPKKYEADCRLPNYRLYLYLEMPTALVDGDTYTVALDNSATVTFLFDSDYTVSRAIKVNQVGYHPNASHKWAYMGGYLFGDGQLDLSYATSFSVINADTGVVELTGTPRLVESNPGFDDDYGSHTSTSSATVLTDSTQSWTTNALVGNVIYNMTDGSQGTITANTTNTATVSSLSGGANNTFENGDHYSINTDSSTTMFGEDVYRLDFSALSTTGNFFIKVPGVGRSWAFKHSTNAFDQAAYTATRGLYHQRVGQTVGADHTKWPRQDSNMGPNYYHCDHVITCIHEEANSRVINSPGPASYDRFDMVGGSYDTSNPISQTSSGHSDAADWDCGIIHLTGLFDFMYAFQFNSNLASNSFNIDESGNGIPDLLNEVIHGLEVWRIGQDGVTGGIPGQLESWTHPNINQDFALTKGGSHTGADNASVLTDSSNYFNSSCIGKTITNNTDGSSGTITSVTDNTVTCSGGLSGGADNDWDTGDTYSITLSSTTDYCYSKPTCYSSAVYAAAAAMLSRLVAPYDAGVASTYLTSAIAAYDFAKDSGNLFTSTNLHGCNDRGAGTAYTVEWTEGQADVDPYLMFAKLQLYIKTGTSTYITETPSISTILGRFTKVPFDWEWTHKDFAVYCYYSIIEAYNAGYTGLSSEASTWSNWITARADRLYGNCFNISYPCSYETDNLSRERMDYSLGFGNSNMMNFNRCLELAYQITSAQKYRDAIQFNMDFMLGCNPLGMSWTTGIGSVYPICVLSNHDNETQWQDPVPGITLYGINGSTQKYFTIRDKSWAYMLSQNGVNLISSATQTGGTATITTSENHGLATGENVYIESLSPSDYNGSKQITVTGPTTFTFAIDSGATSPATGTGEIRRDFLMDQQQRSTPIWRTFSNSRSAVVNTEFTLWETMASTAFSFLLFSSTASIEDLFPREGDDLHGQWLIM